MTPGRCCWPLAQLVWVYLLLHLVAPAAAGRQLAQQQAALARGTSAFDYVVTPEPTTQWQGGASCENSAFVIQFDAVLRLTGADLIPYTIEQQETVIRALRETFLRNVGPVELTQFREYYPDPAVPAGIRESNPGVEFHMLGWYLISNVSDNWQDTTYKSFVQCARGLGPGGTWALSLTPAKLVSAMFNRLPCPRSYILQPLVVLALTLAVTPTNLGVPVEVEQVSAAAEAISGAVVGQRLGSLVEVVGHSQLAGTLTTLVQVEVTLYKCRSNATLASPECERQVLAEVLQSAAVQQQWTEAGLKNTTVVSIRQRRPPPPPSTASQQQKAWIPWHLDRLDQRTLPLDGSFTANASGSGVNVYVISSGVRGDHAEFKLMDGTPGTRVQSGWGFQGLNPLQEDPMSGTAYGFGTYAASLCCGLKVGVAKNATIHSVRFQEGFLLRPSSWSEGGLPAALDFVLSTNKRPAVVLIDTLWVPGRMSRNDSSVVAAILSRLDKLQKANLTAIAPALGQDACLNIIASHPGVISVAGTNTYDHAVAFSASNSSCIDMWAPSGGVGFGLVGAEPSGPTNYTRVITKGYAAAAQVAGIAAQYLQFHPDATAMEVRRALLETASNHTVTGAGISPTLMAFTNLTQASVEASISGDGAALSTGAIVGIAIGATVAVVGAAAAAVFILRRGNRRSSGPLAEKQDWQVPLADIAIVRRPDGSPHFLGSGRYGSVYKAIKGGVQVVAVREMNPLDNRSRAALVQKIDMLKSRDANLVQFYGACIRHDRLLLIMEYMEGGDLFDALASGNGKLQWFNRGKEVMLDVLRGLVSLHRSGVVHRDISSKNILLGRDGQAKLSDVGLAQLLKQDSPAPVGALPWAAPEVLLGAKVTEKADIYSMGVVLWELVTCEMPQRGQLRALEVPRECPQGVADAIRDCMQLGHEARPSAKELFDRLWNCIARTSSDSCTVNSEIIDSRGSPIGQLNGSARESGIERRPSSSSDSYSLQLNTLDPNASAQRSRSGQLSNSLTCSSAGMEREASGGVVTMDSSRIQFCTNGDGSRQQLGTGAYGAVYRVLLDGVQPLAAKEISLGTNTSIHSTFTREAEMLWRLRHRNIVTLSGIVISEGRGYMLMELMEGGSLFDLLNLRTKHSRRRVFGWYQRGAALILDIARGLHYIHSMRVSHFDIKSHNILLTRELHAKIADVGLSRALTCTHHSLDCTAGLVGTFPYMAPELLAGSRCTQSVDIFAVGVLIHEICSGEHPVRGRMRPLQVPQECPQEVADLMRDCKHNDPSRRPTARELVQRLTALVPSRTTATAPTPTPKGDMPAAAGAGANPPTPEATPQQAPGVEVQSHMTRAASNPLLPVPSSPFQSVQAAAPLLGGCQPAEALTANGLSLADGTEPLMVKERDVHMPAPAISTFASPFEAMKAVDLPGPS